MSTYDPTKHEDAREERAREAREFGLRRVRVVMLFQTPPAGVRTGFCVVHDARVVDAFGDSAVKIVVEEPDEREATEVVEVLLFNAGTMDRLIPSGFVYVGRAMTGDAISGGLLVYVERKWVK